MNSLPGIRQTLATLTASNPLSTMTEQQRRLVLAASLVGVVAVASLFGLAAIVRGSGAVAEKVEVVPRRQRRRMHMDMDMDMGMNQAEADTDSNKDAKKESKDVKKEAGVKTEKESPPTHTHVNTAQPDSFLLQHAIANGFGPDLDAQKGLHKPTVMAIVNELIDADPLDPPINAFKDTLAGTSGRPAVGTHASSLAVRESTPLPPFHAQIKHINDELKSAKTRGRPLLLEGPPGLGKGTALMNYLAEEGLKRPTVYLQLSKVLRKKHGASSFDEEFEDEDSATIVNSTFTETETEMEGEERIVITVRRDAILRGLYEALGFKEESADLGADLMMEDLSPRSETPNQQEPFNMKPLNHIAQALRLIAARSKSGPTILVLDDVQLLFRERIALTDRYDGIAEIFEWFLRCEVEGILDVIFCSSEKSAVGGIKRLRGYDWALKLHAVESVDDEVVIAYLLNEVNPLIKEAARKFTEESAALFVATFDGSLLELDNYYRDAFCNVQAYISRRERSFYRRLQRHLPSRVSRHQPLVSATAASSASSLSATPRTSTTFSSNPFADTSSYPTTAEIPTTFTNPALLSTEQELRELFLDITMRGGTLPVSKLDAPKMALAESLVERNILRWRDSRIRKRETRSLVKMHQQSTEDAIRRKKAAASHNVVVVDENKSPIAQRRMASSSSRIASAGEESAASMESSWFGGGMMAGLPVGPSWGDDADVLSTADAGNSGSGNHDEWTRAGETEKSLYAGTEVETEETGLVLVSDETGEEQQQRPASIEMEMDDSWAGAESSVPDESEEKFVRDMDAAEQLALFAMEDAELVWSNQLVRNVCEAFVSGTQLLW
ncbi:hypothetical protein CcCBS67573_g06577 [Chytriomyces confervae]|uniref:Uncharacterized protein n=1 Tax=Chytriomyces confervae TaxID=246404 RepID=A0A507F2D5_9FUNG|nr:hypothetical protein CcCBS67573_g06577 [Chytriomyces confervae]